MIWCVLLVSVALHVAMIAILPDVRPLVVRAPELPSLVELTTELSKPKEEPRQPEPTPAERPPAAANRAPLPVKVSAAAAAAAALPTASDGPPGLAVDEDDRADFTASVVSNAAPGPVGPSVVSAPPGATSALVTKPRMVPVGSLSRRPGAPGLDAELEKNYPLAARRSGISGTAKLRVQIHADGRVGRVEQVSETFGGFGEACAKTVRAARWEPPLDEDGRAVATEIVYVCVFEVRS